MHDIEPYYKWRDRYSSERDDKSPFYGRVYSEFTYTNKIYNYFIHPQWDDFGSQTLYLKIIFVDYLEGFAMIELIGEWNDCLHNDIMYLKREVIDRMLKQGIHKYILFCSNVLNFHGSDDAYYEEWSEDVQDEGGWVCFVNTLDHVYEEMQSTRLHYYVNLGVNYNHVNWRGKKPMDIFNAVENVLFNGQRQLAF